MRVATPDGMQVTIYQAATAGDDELSNNYVAFPTSPGRSGHSMSIRDLMNCGKRHCCAGAAERQSAGAGDRCAGTEPTDDAAYRA